jgi:ribosomal protein S12 methylthiotransferase accessory factor YcaO
MKTKKSRNALSQLIENIQATGSYSLPKGAVTTDISLAAYHWQQDTRTVVETFFFPQDPEVTGVPAIRCGNRIACTTDAIWEFIERNAKPLERTRRGGNRRPVAAND